MLIFLYFLLSIFLGKKNPYYYLIFPFVLLQGPGAFIDQEIIFGGKLIFSVSAAVFNETLLCSLLIILLFVKSNRDNRKADLLTISVIVYFIFISIIFLSSVMTSPKLDEVFLSVRPFIYTSVSYFIWLKILASGTRNQFELFLKYLLLITIISDLLYVLNSSKVFEVFDTSGMYQNIEEGSYSFYRDFKTVPLFGMACFIISLIHILRKLNTIPRWILFMNLSIFPFVVLFTFTRSYLIMTTFQILIVYLLNSIKIKVIFSQFRRILLIVFAFIFIWFVSGGLFNAEKNYFQERIEGAINEKSEERNVSVRVQYFETAINILSKQDCLFFGQGFIRDSYQEMSNVGSFVADSTIPILLIHTGWIGVLLVYFVWLSGCIIAIQMFFKTRDWLIQYILAMAIATIISSFIMGTDLKGGVMSLFYFALLVVIKNNSWSKEKSQVFTKNKEVVFNNV